MEPALFPTKPLYRPDQVTGVQDEIKSLEKKLDNKFIEDKGEVQRQLARVRKDFESQVPRAPENGEEEGRMTHRAKELLAEITVGMPSQEEMRKAPHGAVDKHIKWEQRNKRRIAEWKHIMLRLTAGSNERDAANLERHRPVGSTLNMDSAFIPGRQFFMPETAGAAVVFSEDQIAMLRALDPALAERLSTLTNTQRSDVKEILSVRKQPENLEIARAAGKLGVEKREARRKTKRAKRTLTPEQKQALIDRLTAARAAKVAKAKEPQQE